MQLVAKEEIAGMLGRSPDKADSVTMSYASECGGCTVGTATWAI